MKATADLLLKNAIVLTMDEALKQYEPGAVAIQGEQIVAVGHEIDLIDQYEYSELIDCEGKVLMPGLATH